MNSDYRLYNVDSFCRVKQGLRTCVMYRAVFSYPENNLVTQATLNWQIYLHYYSHALHIYLPRRGYKVSKSVEEFQ